MNMHSFRKLSPRTLVLASVVVLLLCLGSAGRARANSEPRVIEITAKQFSFTPNRIVIKHGETVQLRLTSLDITHGFFMRALKIDRDIPPGVFTDILVTPETPGTYTTICDHFCGTNHGNMNMTIVVE